MEIGERKEWKDCKINYLLTASGYKGEEIVKIKKFFHAIECFKALAISLFLTNTSMLTKSLSLLLSLFPLLFFALSICYLSFTLSLFLSSFLSIYIFLLSFSLSFFERYDVCIRVKAMAYILVVDVRCV